DAFSDRKATHMMSALRQADQIVLGHVMVDEKSNEIPAAPELIEALGLTVFPAKAWFRGSRWDGLIQTVLRLERTVCKRDPKTGLCKQTDETVFWVSSASNQTPERWNEWI